MAGKIAWVFFSVAMACTVTAAFTSPFYWNAISICCAVVAIVLGVFGLYFAFTSWKE